MGKRLLLVFIAYMVASTLADAFRLQSKYSEDLDPERIIERDDNGITVTYIFHGGIALYDILYPGRTHLEIPMFGWHGTLGEPKYSFRIDSFEIPIGYDAKVYVVNADWSEIKIRLSPCYPEHEDRPGGPQHTREWVLPVKKFEGALPKRPVDVYRFSKYRDRPILYVKVMPVKSISDKKTMVCEKLVFRIDFVPSKTKKNPAAKKQDSNMRSLQVDEDRMADIFVSTIYGDKKAGRYKPQTPPDPRYTQKRSSTPIPSLRKEQAKRE